MKKILIVGNNDIGLYNFRAELIQMLLELGFKVDFTVPYGVKVELLKNMGAIYHSIELNRRGTSIKEDFHSLKSYKKLMKKVKPNVVLTYTIKPNIYAGLAAKSLDIPCISTITGLGTALQGQGLKTILLKRLYRCGIRKCKFIFFQNKENKKFFLENRMVYENNLVQVAGSGVNIEFYEPQREAHEGVCFLYIARVMRDKGIGEYLEAAKAVKKRHPKARFQILGYYDEDCYKIQVQQMVAEGILEYLGVSNDTRIQMSQADCIVLPSYHEGMSNVLLEGASFGLPLITSNIHGCKEAVEEGVTGFLCEPKDVQSLELALEKFLLLSEEERTEMGRLGRKRMIEKFDRKIVMNQYLKCIQSLIK
ncbi:MAG: glycosyltransferase family 4 protein [Anaerovorax sp.]|nr:glycosyltransferase family 4 protein [Anaerovorax sp.]